MALSGTDTFSVTRDDIIKGALRVLNVIGAGDTPTSEDYTNCAEALNMVLKNLVVQGMQLWKVERNSFATVVDRTFWTVGTGGQVSIHRPLRILEAQIRDSDGNDVPLVPWSREEWDRYPNKSTSGTPFAYYYDPQLTQGELYLIPVPSDTTHTIFITTHQPLNDMSASSDTFDLPQEWFRALKYMLADDLTEEYMVSATKAARIAGKAMSLKDELYDFGVEEASVFFSRQVEGNG